MEQSVTVNGSITTTTTYVAGGLEEVSSNGVGTTLTKYFMGAGGLPTAERVGANGPLSYLASDGQGTVSEALDGGGNVTFAQLYTPYGNARYSSGSSPTSLGYTGQRADSATGLDYYHARYYDPVAGQFASADTVADGLNRYGYVAGNPTTATDPSGHRLWTGVGEGGAPAPTCITDNNCPGSNPTGSNPPNTPQPPKPTCVTDNNCPTSPGGGGGGGNSGFGGGNTGGSGGGGSAGSFGDKPNYGGLTENQFQQLYEDAQSQGLNLTESDIEAMINLNPDLPYYQYELLVQLWGEGIRAYNVKEIAYAENGRLVWLDGVQLQHIIDEHWDDFRDYFSIRVEGIPMVSEETVIGTIFDFLTNQQPADVNGDTYSYGFWDSLFDRWRGVENTFDIVVNDQGMIITAFVPKPQQ